MAKKILVAICAVFFTFDTFLFGQYAKIGNETFISNQNGPLFQDVDSLTESRFVYLFPSSVLGNIQHGDTISSIELIRNAGNNIGAGNLKIYIKNTSLTDFGSGKISWTGNTTGATLVYDQSPTGEIGSTQKFHLIPFYNNLFYYDTTKGKNIILMFEWKQKVRTSGTIFWFFENNFSVNQYQNNQTKFYRGSGLAPDSLSNSSDVHPSIIFNFPRYDKDLEVIKVYSLGKNPVPLGNPDSVRALVKNVGKKVLNAQKIIIELRGSNSLKDTAEYAFQLGEQKFITLPSQFPANKGLDTVIIKAINDDNSNNNEARSLRLENANLYSYRDISNTAGAGGIGFNGSTGDFVAKFLSNKPKSINQITVHFALNGRSGKIGIWESKSNGLPGKLVYESRTITTTAGNFILDLDSAVKVSGSFYVGVRQTTTNNVAFGYQDENPVRPNTFFYAAPINDTNWVDFSPGAPFRFFIEPRLQADTDLTVLNVWVPRDSIDLLSTDTMAPRVEIGNIGTTNAYDSFEVWMQVSQFGNVIYREKVRDTLKAGHKKIVTLKRSLYSTGLGDYEVMTWVNRKNEQVIDNDTLRTTYFLGIKKDIRCDAVFEPVNGANYEYGFDTFFPVVRIRNVGYDNIPNFTTRAIITRGSTVIYNQTTVLNLAKFASRIISFPLYKCNDTGQMQLRFITEYSQDRDKNNDTLKVNFNVVTSYEASADSLIKPNPNISYSPNTNIKPEAGFRNRGLLPFSNAKATIQISSLYTTYKYNDTLSLGTINPGEFITYSFNKNFTPPSKGAYRVVVRVVLPGDRYGINDSLVEIVHVGNPFDYATLEVTFPKLSDTLILAGGPYSPKAIIKNNGFVKDATLVPVICQIFKGQTRVYQSIKSLSLDTGKSFLLNFDNTFIPFTPDTFTILVYTNQNNDYVKANDTSYSYCITKTATDPYAEIVLSPAQGSVFEAEKDSILISGIIGNKGYLTTGVVNIYGEIIKNKQVIHYQKMTLNKLEPRETKQISFPLKALLKDSGNYKVYLITHSSDNQSIFNDTAISNITSIKSFDPKVITSIVPKNDSQYTQFDTFNMAGEFRNVGQDSSNQKVSAVWVIYTLPDDIIEFRDSATFHIDGINQSTFSSSNKSWIAQTTGNFRYELYLFGSNLRYTYNDTFNGYFSIQKKISTSNLDKASRIKIFPNPSNYEGFTIITQFEQFKYQIFDISGKILQEGLSQKSEIYVPLESYSEGMYFVKVIDPYNMQYVVKMVLAN